MIEKISLRLFLACAALCATTMLTGFWVYGEPTEFLGRLAATFFIVGFFCFLVWASLMVNKFYKTIAEQG